MKKLTMFLVMMMMMVQVLYAQRGGPPPRRSYHHHHRYHQQHHYHQHRGSDRLHTKDLLILGGAIGLGNVISNILTPPPLPVVVAPPQPVVVTPQQPVIVQPPQPPVVVVVPGPTSVPPFRGWHYDQHYYRYDSYGNRYYYPR
jgi:hypothetical protein